MKKLPKTSYYNSGQALLLVLLSMAVVLTIVLSILSRSVTDVAVTTRDEEALRAFSAAEAGVERALIVGTDIGETEIGQAEFSADVSSFAEGSQEFSYPIKVLSGEIVNTWFVAHDDDGNFTCSASRPCFTGDTLKICWGNPGTAADSSTTPALEVSVFYANTPGDYSDIRIARATYDPNTTRQSSNNFSSPDAGTCSVGGGSFEFQKTIDLTTSGLGIPSGVLSSENGLQFARLRLLYNTATSHPVGVDANFSGNTLLPAQGVTIDSTGTSGEANRKIDVFRAFGEPPSIFDTAVFSTGGIVK